MSSSRSRHGGPRRILSCHGAPGIRTTRSGRREVLLLVLLALAGCRFERRSNEGRDPPAGPAGFRADISGAVHGRIVGPGVVRYLPPADVVMGRRPGYYFIADDAGLRELGVTFTVPLGATEGSHALVSVSPLEIGTVFAVRADRSTGNQTHSFDMGSSGTIELLDFPDAPGDLPGHRIAGNFDFTARDSDGNPISASGTFDFTADGTR